MRRCVCEEFLSLSVAWKIERRILFPLQEAHVVGRVTSCGAPAIIVLLRLAQQCRDADERLKTLQVCKPFAMVTLLVVTCSESTLTVSLVT